MANYRKYRRGGLKSGRIARRRLQPGALVPNGGAGQLGPLPARQVVNGARAVYAGYRVARAAVNAYRANRAAAQAGPPAQKRRRFDAAPVESHTVSAGETVNIAGRYGKKRPITKAILETNFTRIILRAQGMLRSNALNTTTGACPGYFPLGIGSNVTGDQKMPVAVFDLAQNQVVNVANFTQFRMSLSDTGSPIFTGVGNHDHTGVVGTANGANSWIPEYSNKAAAVTTDGKMLPINTRYVTQDWIDIRLNLYGMRIAPTTYDVILCKLDQAIDPWASKDDVETLKFQTFWQNFGREGCFNPILPVSRDSYKGMTVLKREKITIAAASTTEEDKNPNNVVLKWFIRDGLTRDHNDVAQPMVTNDAANGCGWTQELGATSEFSNFPKAEDRLYLIVKATDTQPSATETRDVCPSFDYCIRKRIQFSSM